MALSARGGLLCGGGFRHNTITHIKDEVRVQVRYEDLSTLLVEERQENNVMYCTFRCSLSGVEASASAPIRAQNTSLMVRAKQRGQRQMWYQIRRQILRWLRRTLGLRGALARFAGEALDDVYDKSQAMPSTEELQGAVLQAFGQVQGQFQYDTTLNRWVGQGTFG